MSGVYQMLPELLPGVRQVLRLADGAVIPFSPANVDYQAYLRWLAEGNEPDPIPVVSVNKE